MPTANRFSTFRLVGTIVLQVATHGETQECGHDRRQGAEQAFGIGEFCRGLRVHVVGAENRQIDHAHDIAAGRQPVG